MMWTIICICLHWSQQCFVWCKLHLNILISVQLCCARSSWYNQFMPGKVFTAWHKISQWTCECLHKATSEVAWLLRLDAHSFVHTCRSGWTWLICRNVLHQDTEKGLMLYVCAVARSTAHQCTHHSSSPGKLGCYGSLRRTSEQVSVTSACVYTSFLSVDEQKGGRYNVWRMRQKIRSIYTWYGSHVGVKKVKKESVNHLKSSSLINGS